MANAKLRHRARLIVLDHHIGIFHHFKKNLFGFRHFQVQGNAFLVAVHIAEISAEAIDERGIAPRVVTLARFFDLDNLGAHVAQ